MKTIRSFFFALAPILVLAACQETAEQRMQDADERVRKEQHDVENAKEKARQEYLDFKADAEEQIRENENEIAALREKSLATADAGKKERYAKRIAELEQKNADLKGKLNAYDYDRDNSGWEEFKKDMNDLETAIRDFFKDDAK